MPLLADLFSGGSYAAAYYVYLWAEVLDAGSAPLYVCMYVWNNTWHGSIQMGLTPSWKPGTASTRTLRVVFASTFTHQEIPWTPRKLSVSSGAGGIPSLLDQILFLFGGNL